MIDKYLGIEGSMELKFDVWCELVARAKWLEKRQIYTIKLAIMEAVSEIFSD